jgi:hypothetical protein
LLASDAPAVPVAPLVVPVVPVAPAVPAAPEVPAVSEPGAAFKHPVMVTLFVSAADGVVVCGAGGCANRAAVANPTIAVHVPVVMVFFIQASSAGSRLQGRFLFALGTHPSAKRYSSRTLRQTRNRRYVEQTVITIGAFATMTMRHQATANSDR